MGIIKTKKWISYILTVSLLFLSGCTEQKEVAQTVPEKSIYQHKGGQVEEAEETLSIYYGTIHNAQMMSAIADDYETATGIRINWTAADNGITTLKSMFAMDEAPDLFQLERFEIPKWESLVADLSNEKWVADIYETSLDTAMIDGKLCAWPHTLEASGIVYNKELFEQAGITKLPETLRELREVCQKLEEHGIQSFGESWRQFGYLAHLLALPFAYEDDAKKVSEQIFSGQKSFTDLKYIDRFFEVYDLTLDYGLGADSVAYNTMDQYPDFANGKMAMMKQGTWVERNMRRLNFDGNIGLMPVPLSDDREENKLQVATTTFLCVNENAASKQKALDFLNWWHTNAQEYLVNIDGVVPPFYSVDISGLGLLNEDMMRYMDEGKAFDGFGYEYWPADFQTGLASPLQSYAAGRISKDETISELLKLYRKDSGKYVNK